VSPLPEMLDERTVDDIAVDRGQPVIAEVGFSDGDPDDVTFYYTRPHDERPYVIEKHDRLGEGVYRCVIDTTGFKAGDGYWRCVAEWDAPRLGGHTRAAIGGRYHVNRAPEQLP
jgi:hypothetical protein